MFKVQTQFYASMQRVRVGKDVCPARKYPITFHNPHVFNVLPLALFLFFVFCFYFLFYFLYIF